MFHRYNPMPCILSLLLAVLGTSALAGLAAAQSNRTATVAFYITENRMTCTKAKPIACNDEKVVVNGELDLPYWAILCVFGGDPTEGIAGVGLGIDYDGANQSGVDAIGPWTSCGTLEFPQPGWPDAGTGNVVTWETTTKCQTEQPGGADGGVTAVAGFFEVQAYTADRIEVIKRPVSGVLSIASCAAQEYFLEPEHGGIVGFSSDGTVKGRIPCRDIKVEDTTWGNIKSTYDDN